MAVRVLLADDHWLVREGLRRMLEQHGGFEIVAEAATGEEAIEAAQRTRPEIAVVDIGMRNLNGIEATAQILKHCPQTAVLILSMHSDERYVVRAVRAGARGYVLKDAAGDELIRALETVFNGGAYFSAAVGQLMQRGAALLKTHEAADRYHLLTERERLIYQLVAEGNSNRQVAERLGLSLHTVETHRARVMDKLDLHSTAELVLSAVRRGLVA
jgi:DNA-binding NarL/FixJ family response regulator